MPGLSRALDAIFDNWDGYFFQVNNFYLYEEPKTQRFLLLPHGGDQFFGTRDLRLDSYPMGELGKRLARSQLIKDKFLQETERILQDLLFQDELRAKVDSLLRLIDTAANRDPKTPFTQQQRMIFSLWTREFLAARLRFLETNQINK